MNAALITALINMLLLVFKSWTEWDAEKKQKEKECRDGWKDAAKSGDLSVINAFADKLRK